MELVITEKPSVAQSIAKVIGAGERCDGYLRGGGYIVSWCVGHLIELATPDKYDAKYKKWDISTLPIIPDTWKYAVKKDTREQFNILKRLMSDKDVTAVICATDAGREGELIFRLVYEQAGCRKPVKRLWISSMEDHAIRAGFENLRPGSDYDALYDSARCRQWADWLIGINGTRYYTALHHDKVLKVGRVQTPTLNMMVEREALIRDHKPEKYYTVHVKGNGIDAVSEKFKDKSDANIVAIASEGQNAIVNSISEEVKESAPPKLYDLTSLQRDANRIFGMRAKETLDCAQSLYEKKLCTYPRTDSQYLTDDMGSAANAVIGSIGMAFTWLEGCLNRKADLARNLDSSKVSDHHAIIPTTQLSYANRADLSEGERKVLALIATRLVCATSGKYRYRSIRAEIVCGGHTFTMQGQAVIDPGYKEFEQKFRERFGIGRDKDDEDVTMPVIMEHMVIENPEISIVEGETKPPKHYTEDSLLKAMEKAGAEDMADDVERKGLGTPATRADIIEKLVKDGYVRREKKQMIPTAEGMKLIAMLPDAIKSPQMTADWENTLSLIAKGEYRADEFMNGIKMMVTDLIQRR